PARPRRRDHEGVALVPGEPPEHATPGPLDESRAVGHDLPDPHRPVAGGSGDAGAVGRTGGGRVLRAERPVLETVHRLRRADDLRALRESPNVSLATLAGPLFSPSVRRIFAREAPGGLDHFADAGRSSGPFASVGNEREDDTN